MKAANLKKYFIKTTAIAVLTMTLSNGIAQEKKQVVRIARIEIDPVQLASYKAALTEIGELSLKMEPGVLMLFSVAELDQPNHITVMEIYADSAAYKAHLQTVHFKKYKQLTNNMVLSLKLVEVQPIFAGIKPAVLTMIK